ncbi:MAG: hypothetical protein KA104_00510 [Candidatus Pacebacteria bacterium]|nr:hypothetical protein [Candidatus Paceibacterota bacterium]
MKPPHGLCPELMRKHGFFNLLNPDFEEEEKKICLGILISFDELSYSSFEPVFVHGRHITNGGRFTFVFAPETLEGYGCLGHVDLTVEPFGFLDFTRIAMPVGFQTLKLQLPRRLTICQ